jgi:tripartite-type tricarboxylate transporter receptor subunit TctC
MLLNRMLLCALACVAVIVAAADARAQSYPSKPIRMIVPFPPGGPIDVMGRITGDRLSQGVGQTVVIENRPGAGAVIGSRAVATAEPDGYTLLFGSSGSLAVTPALYKNAGYDPVKSFAPVAAVAEGPLVLAVHPSVPAKTVAELVAHAKTNAGKLNYGSGLGTPPHIAYVLFVPYQGAAPAITDLVAGRHAFIIDAPGVLMPHIQEGRLRALAVTSPQRYSELPDVPTMAEAGLPEFLMTFWTGVVAPANTPPPVIERLNRAINDGLNSAEMKKSLARFRVEPRPGPPQNFAKFIASESKKWADVITAANIKLE